MGLKRDTIAPSKDLQQTQDALAVRLRYEAGLSSFSTALLSGTEDGDAAITQALRHLLKAANSSRVYIAENTEDPTLGLCMRLKVEVCAPGVESHIAHPALQRTAYAQGWQRWRETLAQGQPITGAIKTFPASERTLLQMQSICSILVLPIFIGPVFHGFIGFDDVEQARTWDDSDVGLLRMASEILAAHLQRRRTDDELRRKYEQLHAVQNLSDTAGRAASLDEIYAAALDSLQKSAGADHASVLLFDPDGVMRFKAWLDLSEGYRNAVEGHTPWLLTTRNPQPVLYPDVTADAALAAPLPRTGEPLRDVVLREGIYALGMFPLVYQGRLLGKFMVYYDAPHHFETEETRFLQTLAGTIAFAIARKRAEVALSASEQRYRLFLQNFTGIAYQMALGYPYPSLFEGAVEEITGYTADAFLRGDVIWPALMHPDDRKHMLSRGYWLLSTVGATLDHEYRVLHRSGEVRWVRDIARHVVEEETGRSFMQGAIYDVTAAKRAEEERLEMERRLLHGQKLESLGVLAGGIAHDFNNLLLAISGNLEVAALTLQGGRSAEKDPLHAAERTTKFIERALGATHNAAGLAQQMLAYSGRGQFVVEPVNLSALVTANADLLRSAIARNRELVLDLDPDVPEIPADPSQVHQVIMNLVTNAAEAMGENGGRIRLSTGARDCDEAYLAHSRSLEVSEPGLYVYLEVEDSGCGMSAEVIQRIFEPFFTTKFTGRGLGMAAVLGIVRSHRGAIMVTSAPQVGTCVRVLFPVPAQAKLRLAVPEIGSERNTAAASAAASAVNQRRSSPPQGDLGMVADKPPAAFGSRLVLVADDEPMVRSLCKSLLEEWGYTPLLAADGEEALALFRTYGDHIVCVVLDLTMPRLDGVGALKAMRALQPAVRVILSSGYSQHETLQRFRADEITTFIQKPYRAGSLRMAIDAAVAGSE
jgi:PAS domain S-box-containing protein